MFLFEKDQISYDVKGVKLGGQPGAFPTVLIGSIFYRGHKIVKDAETSDFDRAKAESLINQAEELSDTTGNPSLLDVVISYPNNVEKYIDFVQGITEMPFLIDATTTRLRIEAVKYVKETGLSDRVIFSSISPDTKEEEIPVIKESGIKTGVILAFNKADMSPQGRIGILTKESGLLDLAKKAGIENFLIDTVVLDPTSLGPSVKAINLVKTKLGFPAGCGPTNAIDSWETGREKFSKEIIHASDACSDFLAIIMGADFVLYGPIERAKRAFPLCGLADAITAYTLRREGMEIKTRNHPLYKIM